MSGFLDNSVFLEVKDQATSLVPHQASSSSGSSAFYISDLDHSVLLLVVSKCRRGLPKEPRKRGDLPANLRWLPILARVVASKPRREGTWASSVDTHQSPVITNNGFIATGFTSP